MPVYLATPQQVSFNFPYHFLSGLKAPGSLKNEDADQFRTDFMHVQEDDIVLVGSDGLFDNISSGFLCFALNYILLEVANGELDSK